MKRHSVSDPIASVIECTGGRAVVPDTRLSHLVSVLEITSTCVLVMVENSLAPGFFPLPAKQNRLLPFSYDSNVPTHPNEQLVYYCPLKSTFVTPSSFSVFEYV